MGTQREPLYRAPSADAALFEHFASLLGLGVGPGPVLVQLLFQPVLPLVPVEEGAQDGGETVLGQRAHGAYQLQRVGGGGDEMQACCAINIPKREIAIGASFVCLRSSVSTKKKKKKNPNGTRGLISSVAVMPKCTE